MKMFGEDNNCWECRSVEIGEAGEIFYWTVKDQGDDGIYLEYHEGRSDNRLDSRSLLLPSRPEMLVALGKAISALGKSNVS